MAKFGSSFWPSSGLVFGQIRVQFLAKFGSSVWANSGPVFGQIRIQFLATFGFSFWPNSYPVFGQVRVQFLAKFGSGAPLPKLREISKILSHKYFRQFYSHSFLFSYFWCQTSSVRPTAPDPVQILQDPFSGSRTSLVRLTPKE